MALEPADETLGRYRLFARLGRGGMAELHVARMTGAARVEKFVVIKRMLRHLADDPQFVAMFENEGRIAVRLEHPNVCQTYELDTVDGQLFLVMELVRGLPWSTVVRALPDDELAASRFIVGVLTQACEGLHYAHHLTDAEGRATPVVHRDVSPGNLMITNEGAIKLLDFGVSKLLTDDSATRAGMIKGKLPYMAPEHIRGEQVDPRADIFSLGVVMWEALAGEPLFDRGSDLQIFKAIVEDPIPALPQTPIRQRLETVVRRALARKRDDRQASARVLADELRTALSPFGMPMTQGEIQQAMSAWLAVPLATANQDLAAAISRLRATGPAALTADETRTSVDLIVGRAPETVVLGVPRHPTDVDADADAESAVDPLAHTALATKLRLPSEPSMTSVAPTAPRPIVTPKSRRDPAKPTTVAPTPSPALTRPADPEPGERRVVLVIPNVESGQTNVVDAPRPTRLPSVELEPSVSASVPTAPRPLPTTPTVVVDDDDDEESASGLTTEPRAMPPSVPESAPTRVFDVATPRAHADTGHPHPHVPQVSAMPAAAWPALQPSPGALPPSEVGRPSQTELVSWTPGATPRDSSTNVRMWLIAVVVISGLAGVFAAIVSS